MTTTDTAATSDHAGALAAFDRTTSRAGRLTMIAGLILSLSGPIYLAFFSPDITVTTGQLWAAFLAVAAVFAAIWIVEPLTYFPILGPAAMYQAFMIGNISSKLLPCALVAQERIGAKQGTRRGDFAAVAAICGAASVHLVSLLVFVGILGSWLVAQLPADVVATVRTFVLPSVLGAVIVQAVVSMRKPRVAVVALLVALVVQFVLVPALPVLSLYATAVAVLLTILLSWVTRDRRTQAQRSEVVA